MGQGFAWAALFSVGLGWGATGYLSKLATETGHSGVTLAFWQTVIAAAAFSLLLCARGTTLPISRRHLVFYGVCGLLGTALPHSLSFISIRHLPVGVQALTLSTVPMLTLLIALPLGIEPWRARRALGIGLGLAGMLAIALPDTALPDPGQAAWLVLPILVALSYAIENNYISRCKPADADALQIMCGLSWMALAMLAPVQWASAGPWWPREFGPAEAALLGCGLLHVGSYFAFVWLIGHAGPVFAAQVGYIVTLTGMALGMVLLGERHSAWIWAALSLLFAGLALVRPGTADAGGKQQA